MQLLDSFLASNQAKTKKGVSSSRVKNIAELRQLIYGEEGGYKSRAFVLVVSIFCRISLFKAISARKNERRPIKRTLR